MFFKRSHIVIFFCLSVFTAYIVHLWNKSNPTGFADFASQTPKVLSDKVQKIINTSDNVAEELRSYGSRMTETEDPQNCAPERNYFEQALQRTAPIYREERTKSPNEFPRVCVTYIMRSSFPESDRKLSPSFAVCDKDSFRKGSFKPCVTEQYVNVVYNYLGDITECLGISQRDLLPQLYYGSGMHLNVLGKHGEMGLTQVSKSTVAHAEASSEKYLREISESGKASCQRLSSYLKYLKLPVSDKSASCRLISLPESPLYNLFYFAVAYKQNREILQGSTLSLLSQMKSLGLNDDQVDQEQLLQILSALSFHTGVKSAIKMLGSYLQTVESAGRKLEITDFDFSVADRGTLEPGAMSFPEYLSRYQDTGSKNYLNFLQQAARELNAVFKEGVCAPDSYLKL